MLRVLPTGVSNCGMGYQTNVSIQLRMRMAGVKSAQCNFLGIRNTSCQVVKTQLSVSGMSLLGVSYIGSSY
jgi:hypothetical protein